MNELPGEDGSSRTLTQEIDDIMDNEHGAASKAQDKSAMAKFNTFLQAHVCCVLHLECLETEQITKDLIGKFASFLLQDEHVSEDNAFNKDLKSHSSRRGSAVQASSNAYVSLSDVVHRGRWTMDGFATLLEYIAERWEDPSHSVFPPQSSRSVDSIEAARLKHEFASALFIHYHDRLQSVEFIRMLAASLLLYYETTHQLAPNHLIHKALSSAVKKCCPELNEHEAHQMLLKWSAATRVAFVVDHLLALPASQVAANLPEDEAAKHYVGVQSFQSSMQRLVTGMRTIAKDVQSLRTTIQEIKDSQNEIKRTQTAILDVIRGITSQPTRTSHERKDRADLAQSLRPCGEPQWPDNLRSLARVSLSSLVYQFLYEGLQNVRRDRSNRAQTEALAAMKIAYELMGTNKPAPFHAVVGEEARAQWVKDVRLLALSIQAEVEARLEFSRGDHSRQRKPSGTVSSVCSPSWSPRRGFRCSANGVSITFPTSNVIVTLRDSTSPPIGTIAKGKSENRETKLKDTLQVHAKSNQKEVLGALSKTGQGSFSESESFWVTNQVIVRAASSKLIAKLKTLPSVADVSPERRSGASIAAPHVTGAITLHLSAKPTATCEQVKQYLQSSAATSALGRTGYTCGNTADGAFPNNQYGCGRVGASKILA
ncbi:60s ribosomal protein l11-1, partial [Globisporangium splendens]